MYSLSDLGVLSNLIGYGGSILEWLSIIHSHEEWIIHDPSKAKWPV